MLKKYFWIFIQFIYCLHVDWLYFTSVKVNQTNKFHFVISVLNHHPFAGLYFEEKIQVALAEWVFSLKYFGRYNTSINRYNHIKVNFDRVMLTQQNMMKNSLSGCTTTETYVVLDIFCYSCKIGMRHYHYFISYFFIFLQIIKHTNHYPKLSKK